MAVVSGCEGVNGRLIGVEAQYAMPLSLGLSYGGTVGSFGGFSSFGANASNSQQGLLNQIGVVIAVQASMEIAAQLQNALNDIIYITPFGDKPGTIQITFLANRVCNGGTSSTLGVIEHYLQYRLLPDQNRSPATIVIGGGAFRSFLFGMQLDAQSAGEQLVRGVLLFRGWPE